MNRAYRWSFPSKLVVIAILLGGCLLPLFTADQPAPSSAIQAQEKTTKPKPKDKAKKKKAQREPLVIPDVARDQLVCFCLYTVHNRTLKLSAQLYPLNDGEDRNLQLHVARDGGDFEQVAEQAINPDGWMTTFRLEQWDDSRPARYRVTHALGTQYEGTIRQNPRDKDEIVVGNLSCNSNTNRGPRADIVANLKAQDPDLLFFAGDQSYDHR